MNEWDRQLDEAFSAAMTAPVGSDEEAKALRRMRQLLSVAEIALEDEE